jgi:hypothetical protein
MPAAFRVTAGIHPRASGLRMEEPRAVGDPMHVETSFVRNLGGLIRVRQGMPDRLMKAKGRTMSMHADEESDEVVLCAGSV